MTDGAFVVPVYVKHGNHRCEEVSSIRDALSFLEKWPEERRGVIWETVCRACRRAHDGMMPVSAARQAFEAFARMSNILVEKAIPEPWVIPTTAGSSTKGGVAA
jgi:hypothetical protein